MNRFGRALLAPFAIVGFSGVSAAMEATQPINPPADGPPFSVPGRSSYPSLAGDWTHEFGLRHLLSSGRTSFLLKDHTGTLNVSRLTWTGETGIGGEAFVRFDHSSGFFIKGALGLSGFFGNGNLRDEDFAPVNLGPGLDSRYSSTSSGQKGGFLQSGNFDIGYDFLHERRYALGGFVGYQYLGDHANAYGCAQSASNSLVCSPGQVAGSAEVITDTEYWNALRVGVEGSYLLLPQLRVSGEAAYLPYAALVGWDYHWLRQDVTGGFNGSTPSNSRGDGFQLEGKLDYAIRDWWTVGVGARYLAVGGNGVMRFDLSGIAPVGYRYGAQQVVYHEERYGVFMGSSVKF